VATGWRILYMTSREGTSVLASAVVVVPDHASTNPPVIAWAHGTTGITEGCAPSLLEGPFDNVPDINAVAREGWVYVGTDYPGLGTGGGHTYLVGPDAARAVLDAVRAARQLRNHDIGDRIVVWGHSQGGNSALWTGSLAADYAPELNLAGVAALAPATDLKGLLQVSRGSVFGKIVSAYVITAYSATYPDVKIGDYVDNVPGFVIADISHRCVAGYQTLFSAFEALLLPSTGIFKLDPTTGPLGARLKENTPEGSIAVPVLIAQGEADDLVVPEVQRRYVDKRCAAGQQLDYRTYRGRDHISIVAPDSPLIPELIQWTRERFEEKPAEAACP
jgi:acetyl esterase/lipase